MQEFDNEPLLDEFSAPKHDKLASATRKLIDQADAYAERSADYRFIKSQQTLLNNRKFEDFSREALQDLPFTPSKIKQIEETYLLENFDTIQKRPPKKHEPVFHNIGSKFDDFDKFIVTNNEVAEAIIRGAKDESVNIECAVPNDKIDEFCDILQGRKISDSLSAKLDVLNQKHNEIKNRQRAENKDSQSGKVKSGQLDSKGQPGSARSGGAEAIAPVFDTQDNDNLDVIFETNQEYLNTLTNKPDEIASVWEELRFKGWFKRHH